MLSVLTIEKNKKDMGNTRILFLDLAKLTAIFLVVWGHVIVCSQCESACAHTVHHWIYTFHMPLFMLLSSFFAASSLQHGFITVLKKKFSQLLVPCLSCTLLCLLYIALFRALTFAAVRTELIGNSWFLKTLFVNYMVFYALKKTRLQDGWLFVLSYAAILAVPHSYSLQFSWLYPFFWMGYFLKRKFQWMTDHMKALTLVSAVAYGVFYMLCHQDMETLLALLPSMSSIASAPLLLLSKFVLASAGSFLCIGLCHYAEKWVVPHDIIAKIAGYGKYTLGVYIIQTILIYEIYADVVGETAQGHGVLYTLWVSVFMLALCLMLIKFLARYKFIDRLLFGGQYYKDRT